MNEILQIANSPVVWVLAFLSIFMVLWQTWIFYHMAQKYVKQTQVLSPEEIKKSLKIGAISTIGPAIAVFTVAVVLIGLVGGPITLSRVGVIGSAAFESLAASAGSDGKVGTPEFTPTLLATAAWVMAIGGSGWLVTTFILTKGLDNAQEKMKNSNPIMIALIGSITPFMVFAVMGYGLVEKKLNAATPTYGTLAALIAGGLTMYVLNVIGQSKDSRKWLLEWAMGIAIIVAMIAGVLVD